MTAPTDWVSAIAILAAGLILGAMFLYFFRRRSTSAPAEDLELIDLEAKRDVLLQQLRELDDVGSKLMAPQAAEERTRLELETARVLRSIDERKKKPAPKGGKVAAGAATAEVVTAAPAPNRSALVGFAWGVGSVLVLVGLGWFVMNQARDRQPGEGMAGGMGGAKTGTMDAQRPPTDPAVLQAEALVKAAPENLDARVELARAYLEHDNLMGVFDQTQVVLQKSPNDSRALTYQALVRMAMGQTPLATEMLQKATKNDPKFIDAWVALGWVNAQQGKMKDAEAAINEAVKLHPEEKARLEEVFAQMKQQAASQKPAQASLPADHPSIPAPGGATMGSGGTGMPDNSPMIAGAPAAAPAATEAAAIHVTLDVDPASKSKLTGNGVLYIIARAAGVTAGPPVAVKRIPAGQFPLSFDIGSADSMMGQPIPPQVRLEARLDHDGDAATRSPNDLDVVADPVASGATVKLILK